MQGYLIKRKRLGAVKLFTCYTKRYFILNADDLIFTYSKKEGSQPKEVIPMTVRNNLIFNTCSFSAENNCYRWKQQLNV